MKSILFILFAFFTLAPGILLLAGANRFKSRVEQPSGIFILLGSSLLLLHLFVSAGTYYFSFMGDAEALARYSMTKSWLGSVVEFIGLTLLGVGLLIHKKSND